ncbi:MAG: DUF4421 family protein [Bacteroidota bacterium]
MLSLSAFGQERDTAYIATYQDRLLIGPYLRYRTISQSFFAGGAGSQGLIKGNDLGIQNQGIGLGARVVLGRLGLGGTLPLRTIYPLDLEQTKSLGLSGELMFQKVALGGGLRFRRGFNTRSGNDFLFREDLRRWEIDVSTIYAFNHERYSFRGPLRLVERQKQSAGSFLLAFQAEAHLFQGDSVLVAGADVPLRFQSYRHLNLLPAIGYGGTWVKGDWYASIMLLAYGKFSLLGLDGNRQPISIGARPHERFAVGYHSDRWFLSLNGLLEQDFNWGSKTVILESQRTIYLSYGYRFDPPNKVRKAGRRIERLIWKDK